VTSKIKRLEYQC